MKNIFYLLLAAVCILTSCDMYDEPKDSVEEVVMTVSSETGVKYAFDDDSRTHPIECMLVMLADAPGEWITLEFHRIEGFNYEKGHEHELLVKRTILANPPADGSDRTYSLVRILTDRVAEGL